MERLLVHVFNLNTKSRHIYLCLGFFALILLENTLWCDQMLHSSSSTNISGNSKWVEADFTRWDFLVVFSTGILKKNDNNNNKEREEKKKNTRIRKEKKKKKKLEEALVYMPLTLCACKSIRWKHVQVLKRIFKSSTQKYQKLRAV